MGWTYPPNTDPQNTRHAVVPPRVKAAPSPVLGRCGTDYWGVVCKRRCGGSESFPPLRAWAAPATSNDLQPQVRARYVTVRLGSYAVSVPEISLEIPISFRFLPRLL